MITISDYIDVRARVSALNCNLTPTVVFLPSNFEEAASTSQFVFRGELTSIQKILRFNGIDSSLIGDNIVGQKPGYIHNKSHDWAAPIIFISAELLKTNPDLISLAIDTIRDHVASLFKTLSPSKKVKAEIVIERDGDKSFKKITYEGDVAGLSTIADMVAKINATD
ncbi:hypothetical protein [Novosphingobium sp. fls2-241-R2A-195]|uniref:hypothetical protein n=1 Tax=Novosphingobium sp. fls2-241-R2A-195 TaxID=3040296 RepID=UPI00254C6E49|nr:hypothetical protein [Novosphingobium sp. fls2-241-R2A-195]